MRPFAKFTASVTLALGLLCFTSCTSKDAGETLSVSLGDAGLVMLADSISTSASTPTKYKGKTSLAAVVRYRGNKTLAYNWEVALPGPIGGTMTTKDSGVDIDAEAIGTGTTPPDIGDGMGSVTVTVYEKDGTLLKKASARLSVIISSGGNG